MEIRKRKKKSLGAVWAGETNSAQLTPPHQPTGGSGSLSAITGTWGRWSVCTRACLGSSPLTAVWPLPHVIVPLLSASKLGTVVASWRISRWGPMGPWLPIKSGAAMIGSPLSAHPSNHRTHVGERERAGSTRPRRRASFIATDGLRIRSGVASVGVPDEAASYAGVVRDPFLNEGVRGRPGICSRIWAPPRVCRSLWLMLWRF
jgi:hypothetical protein